MIEAKDLLPDFCAVFVGYSEGLVSRSAHKGCWEHRQNNKKDWAYPIDELK
jgi:hypothetical protein